jgi:hypothetical protein
VGFLGNLDHGGPAAGLLIDVQVLFVLGLPARQNRWAFIHLSVAPRYLLLEIIFIGSLVTAEAA